MREMDAIVHYGHISALRAYSPSGGHWPGTPTRRSPFELHASAFNVRGRWQIATASR